MLPAFTMTNYPHTVTAYLFPADLGSNLLLASLLPRVLFYAKSIKSQMQSIVTKVQIYIQKLYICTLEAFNPAQERNRVQAND